MNGNANTIEAPAGAGFDSAKARIAFRVQYVEQAWLAAGKEPPHGIVARVVEIALIREFMERVEDRISKAASSGVAPDPSLEAKRELEEMSMGIFPK